MKQQDFFKFKSATKGFGGSLLKGANAREKRPVSSGHAIHVVMRSEIAKGKLSMRYRSHRKKVDDLVRRQAERWGMKIYRYANVGNHLHILLRPASRRRFAGFLRSVSGLIARIVLQAERGSKKSVKFWQWRPFTRIVQWGRDFVRTKKYVLLNAKEAAGFLSLRKLERWLKQLQMEASGSHDPG